MFNKFRLGRRPWQHANSLCRPRRVDRRKVDFHEFHAISLAPQFSPSSLRGDAKRILSHFSTSSVGLLAIRSIFSLFAQLESISRDICRIPNSSNHLLEKIRESILCLNKTEGKGGKKILEDGVEFFLIERSRERRYAPVIN